MITKLNNFRYKQNEPLYSNENIEKVKQYIKSGKLPDDLNDVQMKRFIERFILTLFCLNPVIIFTMFTKVSNSLNN